MDPTSFVFGLVSGALIGAVAVTLIGDSGPRPARDDPKTTCRWCDEPMRPSGYIAHEFQRHYVCPLCNRDTFVDDPILKQQKRERIKQREDDTRG